MSRAKIREAVERQLEKSLPKFLETGFKVPWQDRSILMSEAFAFCSIGDLFDIDIVLESGIWLGRSTEIFASYFAPKRVVAVDVSLKRVAVERLEKYDNLTLIQGDGSNQIKNILKDSKIKRAGIFIDGPKESRAVKFAEEFLAYENVSFVGVHDAHKSKVKRMLILLERPLFFTCEKWFLKKYSKLDRNESQWDEEQDKKWIPHWIISKKDKNTNRNLGDYGCTIGFVFNSRKS